ncbi:MAG TPA: hypothetical protein VF503_17570 [Sphingobium sp.]|uniref:hypothetical protein n=1 Tax=Sphingobium sp. TaxID=1912891 RepID=UPI002ED5EDF6
MEPKAAASLTANLLARKGLARPAMRRQPVAGIGPRAVPMQDDLGWNDMGEDIVTSAPPVVPVPSPVAQHIAAIQETLSRRDEERAQAARAAAQPPAPPAPAPRLTPPAPRKVKAKALVATPPAARPAAVPAVASNRKSAFTLRIDAERHLRLRLLSAVTNRSAQQLLIGALDALIAQHPNIDALATDPKLRSGSPD